MAAKTKEKEIHYFLSKNVKIFPCTNRGHYPSDSSEDTNTQITFDPESRLMSEYNFTHLPGIVAGGLSSYIINSIEDDPMKAVIEGYYFELFDLETELARWWKDIDNSNAKAKFNEGYLEIKIKSSESLTSSGSPDRERKLHFLSSTDSNVSSQYLDICRKTEETEETELYECVAIRWTSAPTSDYVAISLSQPDIQLPELKSSMTTLKEDVSKLKKDVSKLKEEVTGLTTRMEKIHNDIVENTKNIGSNQQAIQGLQEQLQGLVKKIDDAVTQADFNSQFSTYTAAVEDKIQNLCVITFDANGGTGAMPALIFTKGASYKPLNECSFTGPAESPTFLGWAETPGGEIIEVLDNIEESLVLYAIWSDNSGQQN